MSSTAVVPTHQGNGPVISGDEWKDPDIFFGADRSKPVSDLVRTRIGQQVVKEMTVDDLKQRLAEPESMDLVSFEPSTTPAHFELVSDANRKRMVFHLEGKEYSMTSDSFLHLATILGIPSAYVAKCPHELSVPHVNHWLKQRGLPILGFAAVDNDIRLFARGQINPVSNFKVLEAVDHVLPGDLSVRHFYTDMHRTNFSIITSEELPVYVGDVVRRGVTIDNSYDLSSALAFSTYLERLICSNGSISVESVMKFAHKGYSGDMDDWMEQALQSAYAGALVEIDKVKALKDVQFDGHLSDSLHSLFAELSVPNNIRDLVLDKIADDGIDNLYDLFNVFTDLGSNDVDVLADPALSRKLMRVGGHLIANPEFCGSCHRVLH